MAHFGSARNVLRFRQGSAMKQESLNSQDTLCPRCAAEAKWILAGAEQETVQITCPDCGLFEIPSTEFEQAEFDISEPTEP